MTTIDELWEKLDHSRGRFDLSTILTELKEYSGEINIKEHRSLVNQISKVNHDVSWQVPNTVTYSVNALLKNKELNSVCDPWASTGLMLHGVVDRFKPQDAYAVSLNANDAELGKMFTPNVKWENIEPLKAKALSDAKFDVVVSILPFGIRAREILILNGKNQKIEIARDLDSQILAAYSQQLKDDGVGIFVVTPGFFFRKSAFNIMDEMGLYVDAVFELPAGTFAPSTNITTNLIVVKKGESEKLFTGKLSSNNKLNKQVINNYLDNKESKNLDFGCFVDSNSFRGIDAFRAEVEFQRLREKYEGDFYSIEQISKSIKLGKQGESFEFSDIDNAMYIPLIGKSNVVGSVDELTMRPQNYAQIEINNNVAYKDFVIHYLNSAIGVDARLMNMTGVAIQRMNKSSLMSLGVFVPKLERQASIIEVSHQIRAQKNMIFALLNELNEKNTKLWKDPSQLEQLRIEIDNFKSQTTTETINRSDKSLKDWIETLPFPLASILRAWSATSDNDPKTKYEHLLHFFEAFAFFTGLVFLSAFRSNQSIYDEHKEGLRKVLIKNPIQHASFGTWKSMVEYFSKQIRDKLKKDEGKLIVEELFHDASLSLPSKLSDTALIEIITETNKYRNQWTGHGGVVGKDDAAQRNELLIESLNKLRSLIGDLWEETELLTCVSMKKRGDEYKNEVLLLMGSNSEFVSENRAMEMPLDEDVLYLHSGNNSQSLPLLPLIRMGASPSSVKNACYFYNRLSGQHEAKFVSYHYVDMPEIVGDYDETIDIIKSLSELGSVQ